MIFLFDENLPLLFRKRTRKAGLYFSIGFALWLLVSACLIYFREPLGRLLTMIIGIILTSTFGIVLGEFLRQRYLPERRLCQTVNALKKTVGRSLEGTLVSISQKDLTFQKQTFHVLTIQDENMKQGVLVELFFWSESKAPIPPVGSKIRFLLSENVVMGYELC